MFLFTHLFAGALAGYGIYRIIPDRNVILFCMAGSVVSDLVDKPLGYLLFPHALDSGRTICHSLSVVILILALALLLWSRPLASLTASFGIGVFLHQILDAMWDEPVTWFYPFLGPFQPFHYTDYFLTFFWIEISTGSEWIFLAGTIFLVAIMFGEDMGLPQGLLREPHQTPVYTLILLLLSLLAVYSLFSAVSGTVSLMAPTYDTRDNLMNCIIALAGCGILFSVRRGFLCDHRDPAGTPR